MRRFLIPGLAVLACLAFASPAMAEPTINVTTSCYYGNSTNFFIEVTGLAPNEPTGFLVEDAEGNVEMTAALGGTNDENGAARIGFGGSIPAGTYTIYAYTGPYQTIGDPGTWPGAVQVDSFDPSLTTSLVSTTVETNCGPPEKQACKVGGFEDYGYRNQGQCVSATAPGRVG